jgi:predicted PhzF superfamily epimerase YddE/YHI9
VKYFIVDAFGERAYTGNPAAICLASQSLDDAQMQLIAAEFNLSETAFLRPLDDEGANWGLRWFTPSNEVNLCGHATLAAAHALWQHCEIDADCLRFDTRSGELQVRREAGQMAMRFPRIETRVVEGLWANNLGDFSAAATAGEDLLIELADEAAVRDYQPDLAKIALLPSRGLIVTAPGEDDCDFVSRFFAPQFGIDEDPVTGSAHCALADYWSKKLGKTEFSARQVSRRGGELGVVLDGDVVILSGRAVSVMAGELL